MAEPLTESQYRSLARFRHALRRFQRFSEDAARAAGLTPSQHQLLLAVRGFDGPGAPSVTEIGELLQLQIHSAGDSSLEPKRTASSSGSPTPRTAGAPSSTSPSMETFGSRHCRSSTATSSGASDAR